MAKTLQQLGEDWVSYGVSIVENPAVPKAKWLAVKSQDTGEDKHMGTYLRRQREQRGLSQDALATKSGIDRGRISQFETGSRNLTLEAAGKLAPHLGDTRTALRARQLGSKVEAAVKSGEAGKSAILRTAAELEDLKSATENDADRKVLGEVISQLEKLAKGDAKPADSDRAEKSRGQRRPSQKGRDGYGRRRRDTGIATKSEEKPRERDGYGRRR